MWLEDGWTLIGSLQSSGFALSSKLFSVPYHITIILTMTYLSMTCTLDRLQSGVHCPPRGECQGKYCHIIYICIVALIVCFFFLICTPVSH